MKIRYRNTTSPASHFLLDLDIYVGNYGKTKGRGWSHETMTCRTSLKKFTLKFFCYIKKDKFRDLLSKINFPNLLMAWFWCWKLHEKSDLNWETWLFLIFVATFYWIASVYCWNFFSIASLILLPSQNIVQENVFKIFQREVKLN